MHDFLVRFKKGSKPLRKVLTKYRQKNFATLKFLFSKVKTGISISATAHLAFVTPHCPFIEFLPPSLSEDVLRKELVAQELTMVNGEITLPKTPGLGIELNWDAMRRFAVS